MSDIIFASCFEYYVTLRFYIKFRACCLYHSHVHICIGEDVSNWPFYRFKNGVLLDLLFINCCWSFGSSFQFHILHLSRHSAHRLWSVHCILDQASYNKGNILSPALILRVQSGHTSTHYPYYFQYGYKLVSINKHVSLCKST